ncbi:MAG TPA: hypothetical protein VM487_06100 [Phycisphaerae bacterium]|nr:hypothetical protein [Phycisphaerae bacterium]
MTDKITCQFGRWELECIPADGARLSVLRFSGRDLVTTCPASFRPPRQDFGEYETRPVYGYDDCFPSVRACAIPDVGWTQIRDHGELCWLKWDVRQPENRLDCYTTSEVLPTVSFRRSMLFGDTSITWEFEVGNAGDSPVPFQHVMHPLMPLDQIADVQLPEYGSVLDENEGRALSLATPRECMDFLLGKPRGTATMLLLQRVHPGRATLMLKGGLSLEMEFSAELSPTFGIWWNHVGYPDEHGGLRMECAFEPIPGPSSSLAEVLRQGGQLTVEPHGHTTWSITWNMSTL